MSHNVELWFLPCLFSTEILYNVISVRIKNQVLKSVMIVSIFSLGYLLSKIGIYNLPWGISPALIMILYFYIGALLKKIFSYNIKQITFIVCIVLSTVVFIILGRSIERFDIATGKIQNLIQFLITSIAGISLIITLSQLLKTNKILEFFGKGDVTLVTLAIQGVVYRPLIFLCNKIWNNGIDQENLLTVSIIAIITYILCGLFSIVYYRFMKTSSLIRKISV